MLALWVGRGVNFHKLSAEKKISKIRQKFDQIRFKIGPWKVGFYTILTERLRDRQKDTQSEGSLSYSSNRCGSQLLSENI